MKVSSGRISSRGSRSSERGWIAVFVAISGLLLIAFLGWSVDLAYTWTTAHSLQKAADAGSMAGARLVKSESQVTGYILTRTAAVNVAGANTASGIPVQVDPNPSNSASGELVIGRWDAFANTFTPDTGTIGQPIPDAVKVVARRTGAAHGPLNLLFGQIFGSPTAEITRSSIARLAPEPEALILVLDLNRQAALLLSGTAASMDVTAGRIHVNSNHACAVRTNGSPTCLAQKLTIVGDLCGTVTALVEPGSTVEPDPLAGLPYPSGLSLPLGPQGQITGGGVYTPGRYPRGIDMNGGTATLLSGVYSFGNGGGSKGIDLKGNALVVGTEVMLFVEQGARVDISGSGAGMILTPPSSGTYFGTVIFSHRGNQGNNACTIGGGGVFDIQGTLYVARGHINMAGTPGKKIGRIIVNTLDVQGTSGFVITGLGLPPPTGSQYVFLVE